MSTPLLIYTDGACKGNPGIGGWGVNHNNEPIAVKGIYPINFKLQQ